MVDFPAAVAPPTGASYAAPLMNFGGPGGITNAIMGQVQKARDMQYTQALRTAFQDGVPMIPGTNMPDYGAMATKLIQLGDTSQGVNLANADIQRRGLLLGQQAAQDMSSGNAPGDNNAPPTAASPPSRPVIPPHGIPDGSDNPNTAPRPAASKTSYTGGDSQGSMMGLISARGYSDQAAGNVMRALATSPQLRGIDPNQPLSPEQTTAVNAALDQLPQPPKSSATTGTSQPRQPVIPPAQAASATTPSSANPSSTTSAAIGDPTLGGLVPSQWVTKFGNDAAGRYVRYLRGIAAIPGIPANTKEAAEKAADQVSTALQKASEPTPEQKNAASVGQTVPQFQRTTEETKNDVVRFGKMAEGFDAAGAAATSMIPHLELARSLMNSPDFYSGTAEGITLAYKRALSALGGDPNQALPQEGFRKIVAANILDQVAQLKAETAASGGSTRIFQSQIQLMEKAAQNPDNTVAANRLLTEIGFRLARRQQQVAELADRYNNGHLDAGFNIMLRKWNADHPLFTPAELSDPRLVAPPTFSSPQALAKAGLPKGTPFRTADGRIKYVP